MDRLFCEFDLPRVSLLTFVLITICIAADPDTSKVSNALNRNDYKTAINLLENELAASPDNATIKSNLALVYNNYAIYLSNLGQYNNICQLMDKARSLDPSNQKIVQNCAAIYTQAGTRALNEKKYQEAEKIFLKAIDIDNSSISSLTGIGRVYYYQQNLTKTRIYWEKALTLAPGNQAIKDLLASLQKENTAEGDFRQVEGYIFDIRYNDRVINDQVYDIRRHLMEAYRTVGQDLRYFPEHKIVVLLYDASQFRGLRSVHDQVTGLFDGKIRIPLNYRNISIAELTKILRHEYTHAIIYDIAGNFCPVWINEGLAVFEEQSDGTYEKRVVLQMIANKKVLSLNQLSRPDNWRIKETGPLFYSQAFVMVDYMIKRWGLYVVMEMLTKMKDGSASFENTLLKTTNCTPTEFERAWVESVPR